MPTLLVDDAELFYEERGHGPTVLLLHGLGSSTLDWTPQIARLSADYRVIALDTRGSGRSRDLSHPGGPFSVAQFARDAAAVLRRIDAAPAHVVGLSMGGMVAFQLAVDHPDLVRTLTIINSGPALVPRTVKERAFIALRLALTRLFGPAVLGKLLAPKLFPRPDQEALRATFRQRMARNDKAAYAATQRGLVGFDVSDRIGQIEAPTLIVAADQDYTPVAYKEQYARRMKRARVVVVEDARHALPIEAPEKLEPILAEHLAAHASESPSITADADVASGSQKGDDHVASR